MFFFIFWFVCLIHLSISEQPFLWGTSGAAWQIEGCTTCDNRSSSIWDDFCGVPSNCMNLTADPSCDDYNYYLTDSLLAYEIGTNAYRLSISWSRILPDGVNINQKGIEHYTNVFNSLLSYNITPFVTMYHWDLPSSIYNITNGGWINETIIDYYFNYAKVLFDNFNGLISHWLTFNEPSSFCLGGYERGDRAPGRCSDRSQCKEGNSSTEPWLCGHNVLLSHAKVANLYRTQYQNNSNNGKIGMSLNGDFIYPMTSSVEDKNASQRSMLWYRGWWGDPLYFGDYPQQMKSAVGDLLPNFTEAEQELLKGSVDFYGMNDYSGNWGAYKQSNTSQPPTFSTTQNAYTASVNNNGTVLGYYCNDVRIASDAIRQMLKWVSNRYNYPNIYITENGYCSHDESTMKYPMVLNDTCRIQFYNDFLNTILDSINIDGINLKGYITWALIDEFEWVHALSTKCGLVYVNYEGYPNNVNQTRFRKNSSYFYEQFISNHKNPYVNSL